MEELFIKARLEAATLPSFTGQHFIPDARLQEIMLTSSVERELERMVCASPELLPGNESSVIRRCDQLDTSPRHAHGAFWRVYAILVLIDRSQCITSFVRDGINDHMLPLTFTTENEASTIAYRSCFNGWDSSQIKAFDERQWTVLPPLLEGPTETFRFPRLDARYILPFTNYSPHSSTPIRGGFSEVFKVRFHAGQSSAHTNNDGLKNAFALKRIYPSTRGSHDLHKEIEALGKFSGQDTDHPHIIKLLAAFSHGDNHFLVFPWADGSLRTLWRENPTPSADRQAVLWLADQLVGLTGALGAIHRYTYKDGQLLSGRHGDIKPENILVFNETSGAVRLCIADFGVARFHTSEARLNHDLPTALTPTYRPPEFDLRSSASQEYDVWSLGCVFLEAAIWALLGYDGLKSFEASRMASIKDLCSKTVEHDAFFALGRSSDLHEVSANIKPSVERCINQLRQAPQCSVFFHDLLDLIKNEMLRIDENGRATSFRVLDRLKEMQQKCRKDADYTAPKTCPLKPPWILRHPNHTQTHTQTQKSFEIKDFYRTEKQLTVSKTVVSVSMAQIPNHYPPAHPGGKRKLNMAVSDTAGGRSLKRAYVDEEQQQREDGVSSLSSAKHQQAANQQIANPQTEEDLAEHQRAAVQCTTIQQPEHESINASQKSKIKKKNLGKTDEDKWREIYRIIFKLKPTDEIPSPYWEKEVDSELKTCHCLSDFQAYLDNRLGTGDIVTQWEVQIGMKLLDSYRDLHCSSQSTKNLAVPTLEYGSTLPDTHSQERQDENPFGDMSEEVSTGLEKPNSQLDDSSLFDFTNDFFQNGTFRWETHGN
ncbi:hypothetical protein G7054_g2170 [Neopestalotiopsis clavispora]|nr:hypothetical protein G7054_g2170 [Neopestalotiopsis clavispora]